MKESIDFAYAPPPPPPVQPLVSLFKQIQPPAPPPPQHSTEASYTLDGHVQFPEPTVVNNSTVSTLSPIIRQ